MVVGGCCMELGSFGCSLDSRKVVQLYLVHFFLVLLGFCSRVGSP